MRACHVEATEGGPHAGGERTEVAICGGRAANRAAQHQLVQHLLDPDRGEKERKTLLPHRHLRGNRGNKQPKTVGKTFSSQTRRL